MDVDDLWPSRLHPSNNHFTTTTMHTTSRLHSENNLIMVGSDGDEDVQTWFPCPFCYIEIEVPLLCTHLQEEHCFDVRNSVCPVCAENLGRDMIGHFTGQHSHMLKRRRKSQRSGQWTNRSSMLSNEMCDLGSFLGVTSNIRGNTIDSTPDPLLSPFLCGVSLPTPKCIQDTSSDIKTPTTLDVKSEDSSISDEAREQDYQERSKRAEFFQQMVLSTIF